MGHTAVERLSFNFMDNKQRADKLINHAKAPEMAVFEELADVSESLTEVAKVFKDIEAVTIKGAKGEKGDKGDQGEQGIQGEKGDTGEKGEDAHMVGPKGDKGDKGDKGADGLDGLDGIDGKDGADGQDGKDGSPDTALEAKNKLESLSKDDRLDIKAIKGVTKLQDKIVAHAVDQSRGILYAGLLEDRQNNPTSGGHTIEDEGTPLAQRTNLNFVGANVTVTDDSGNDATVVTIIGSTASGGATGPQGPQGTQGSQGTIGVQGVTGNDGAAGARGSQGSMGSQGSTGNQGTQGSQGSLGATGATGPQGIQGTFGSRGSQGSQGSQGSIGATGGTGFVVPRSTATGSTLSPAPNANTTDVFSLIAQAGTAAFQATSGTPVEGQKLIVKIVGTGATAYAITWTGGTGGYTAGGVALPTAVVRGKVITVGFMYDTSNSINRWMCVASSTQI